MRRLLLPVLLLLACGTPQPAPEPTAQEEEERDAAEEPSTREPTPKPPSAGSGRSRLIGELRFSGVKGVGQEGLEEFTTKIFFTEEDRLYSVSFGVASQYGERGQTSNPIEDGNLTVELLCRDGRILRPENTRSGPVFVRAWGSIEGVVIAFPRAVAPEDLGAVVFRWKGETFRTIDL